MTLKLPLVAMDRWIAGTRACIRPCRPLIRARCCRFGVGKCSADGRPREVRVALLEVTARSNPDVWVEGIESRDGVLNRLIVDGSYPQ